jgi:uncharacterized membrane protein HdeD (DUF308 family)
MPQVQAYAESETASAAMGGARWFTFMALGLVLLACGAAAIALPGLSTIATSSILGAVLVIAGIATIVQSLQVKRWGGFSLQLLLGAAEVAGGILVVINPMKGAAAIALVVAIVLVAQGLAQLIIALRIRPQPGWAWLLASGVLSLAISATLALRFPYNVVDAPGAVAGLALVGAGAAYIALALGRLRVGMGRKP